MRLEPRTKRIRHPGTFAWPDFGEKSARRKQRKDKKVIFSVCVPKNKERVVPKSLLLRESKKIQAALFLSASATNQRSAPRHDDMLRARDVTRWIVGETSTRRHPGLFLCVSSQIIVQVHASSYSPSQGGLPPSTPQQSPRITRAGMRGPGLCRAAVPS